MSLTNQNPIISTLDLLRLKDALPLRHVYRNTFEYICKHINTTSLICKLRVDTIANARSISERTVIRHTNKLVEIGVLIKISSGYLDNAGLPNRNPNIYQINLNQLRKLASSLNDKMSKGLNKVYSKVKTQVPEFKNIKSAITELTSSCCGKIKNNTNVKRSPKRDLYSISGIKAHFNALTAFDTSSSAWEWTRTNNRYLDNSINGIFACSNDMTFSGCKGFVINSKCHSNILNEVITRLKDAGASAAETEQYVIIRDRIISIQQKQPAITNSTRKKYNSNAIDPIDKQKYDIDRIAQMDKEASELSAITEQRKHQTSTKTLDYISKIKANFQKYKN